MSSAIVDEIDRIIERLNELKRAVKEMEKSLKTETPKKPKDRFRFNPLSKKDIEETYALVSPNYENKKRDSTVKHIQNKPGRGGRKSRKLRLN